MKRALIRVGRGPPPRRLQGRLAGSESRSNLLVDRGLRCRGHCDDEDEVLWQPHDHWLPAPGNLRPDRSGGAAVAFPLGAFYYVDASMDYGVIQRMVTSAPKRKVKPLHRVNSTGQVCGLGFYTESGQNLASLHSKFIA